MPCNHIKVLITSHGAAKQVTSLKLTSGYEEIRRVFTNKLYTVDS